MRQNDMYFIKDKETEKQKTMQLELYGEKTWDRHVFVFALDLHLEHVQNIQYSRFDRM